MRGRPNLTLVTCGQPDLYNLYNSVSTSLNISILSLHPYSSGISFIPYIFDVVSSGTLLSPPVLAHYVLPLSVHGSLPRHSSAEPDPPHVALLREKWGRRVECPPYRSFTDCVLMPLFSTIPSRLISSFPIGPPIIGTCGFQKCVVRYHATTSPGLRAFTPG